MTINELIKELTLIRMQHGDLPVAKMFLTKDSYESSQKEVTFQDIKVKCGTVQQIVTVPHEIFVHRETGERLTCQMKVDANSKEQFGYETTYIVSL